MLRCIAFECSPIAEGLFDEAQTRSNRAYLAGREPVMRKVSDGFALRKVQ